MRDTNRVQSKANLKEGSKMLFRIFRIVALTLVLGLFNWAGSAQEGGLPPTEFWPPYGSNNEHGTQIYAPAAATKAVYDFDQVNANRAQVVAFGFGGAVAWSGHGVSYVAPMTGEAEISCELGYYSLHGGLGYGVGVHYVYAFLSVAGSHFEEELSSGWSAGTGIEIIDLLLNIKDLAELAHQLSKLIGPPQSHTIRKTVPIIQGATIPIYCGVKSKVAVSGGITAFAFGFARINKITVTPLKPGQAPDFAVVKLTPDNPSPYRDEGTVLQVTVKNNGNKASDAWLRIFADGQQQGGDIYLQNLKPGDATQRSVPFKCSKVGLHHVRAEAVPAPDEWQRDNNAMETYVTCRDPNPPHVYFHKLASNPAVNAPLFKEPGDIITLDVTANDDTNVAGLAFWDEDEVGGQRNPIFCICNYTPPLPAKSLQASCRWNAERAAKGPHRVYVTAVDSSGNTNENYQILHIDRDPPTASFSTNPPLMDPPPHLSLAKVVDRKVKVQVSGRDEGFIQKFWWELWSEYTGWQKKDEKDFGISMPWQYGSAQFDWDTRSLRSSANYKVKACAQDPFWPAGCTEQQVIIDNDLPYKVQILDPTNNASIGAASFSLRWIAGDSLSGLYGYIPIFRRGDKIDPLKLLDLAIKEALGTDPDLRKAVDNPSLLGNHAAFVNLGLEVIGGVKAQGIVDIEERTIQFTAPTSPQRYTFYVIAVDRIGNYSISEPVTVDVTAIMPKLSVRASCDNARIKVTPPGITVTGPKFGSFTYPQGTTVELEALDRQLYSCGMLQVQSVFKHWEVQVGTSKTTFTTPKIQITLKQDTTATAIYESAQQIITISKACKDALEVIQDKLSPGRCWNWYMTHTYDLGQRYELITVTGATIAGPSEQKGKKFTWQLRLSEDGQKWFTDPKWVIEAEVGQKKSFSIDLTTQGKGRIARYVQIFAGPGIGKDQACVSKNGCVDWSEIQVSARR
jgi:hypothetical protein